VLITASRLRTCLGILCSRLLTLCCSRAVAANLTGDVRAAEMMADHEPGALEAVYIHQVGDPTTTL
jgi:hypothetical protein